MNKVNWTADERELISTVADLWANGDTQIAIAAKLEVNLWTMRHRMARLGVRFARGGRLVWAASGEPVDISRLLEASAA